MYTVRVKNHYLNCTGRLKLIPVSKQKHQNRSTVFKMNSKRIKRSVYITNKYQ